MSKKEVSGPSYFYSIALVTFYELKNPTPALLRTLADGISIQKPASTLAEAKDSLKESIISRRYPLNQVPARKGNGVIIEALPDHTGDFKLTNATKIYPDELDQQKFNITALQKMDFKDQCQNGIDVTKPAAEMAELKPKTVFYIFLSPPRSLSIFKFKKLDEKNLNKIIEIIEPQSYSETKTLANQFASSLYSAARDKSFPDPHIIAVAPQTLGVVRKEDIQKIYLATTYLEENPEPEVNPTYFFMIPVTIDPKCKTLELKHQKLITELIEKIINPEYFSNSLKDLQKKATVLLTEEILSLKEPKKWIIIEIVSSHRTPPNITIHEVKQAFHLTDDPTKPGIPNPLFNRKKISAADYENPLFWEIGLINTSCFTLYSLCSRSLPSVLTPFIFDYSDMRWWLDVDPSAAIQQELHSNTMLTGSVSRHTELGVSPPTIIAMQAVAKEIIQLALSLIVVSKKSVFSSYLTSSKLEYYTYKIFQRMNSHFQKSTKKYWAIPNLKERHFEAAITYTLWNHRLHEKKLIQAKDVKDLKKSKKELMAAFRIKN